MELRIDKAGRIVLPKPLRTQLGLKPDTVLEVVQSADGILLRPVGQRPSMREVDGLWVHQGEPDPGADWTQAVADVRSERLDAVWKA